MEAHILNVVIERDIPVIPLSISLPFESRISHPGASSSASRSTSSSNSPSSSLSSSLSTSTSTSASTSTTSISSSFDTPVAKTPTHTVTAVVSDASSSPSSSPIPSSQPTTFLQNKPLSGFVFGVAGLTGLVLVVLLITFAIRRRRNKNLIEDALSFDPVKMGNHDSIESGKGERIRATVSAGHANNGTEVRQSPAFIDYAPPPNSPYHPRPYHPPASNVPSYLSLQGQYNTARQPYSSTYHSHQSSRYPFQVGGRS